MLVELLYRSEGRVSYSKGKKQLEETRHLLDKFLRGGTQKKASFAGRTMFGHSHETYREIPVKIEGEEYSLKISTPSLLRPGDNSMPIFLALSFSSIAPVLIGPVLNEIELPTGSIYSTLENEKRWQVDHYTGLIKKDIDPILRGYIKMVRGSGPSTVG